MHHASVNMGQPSFYYFIPYEVECLLSLFVTSSVFFVSDRSLICFPTVSCEEQFEAHKGNKFEFYSYMMNQYFLLQVAH